MSQPDSELQLRIIAFAEAASKLAESVRNDVVSIGKVSEQTVLSLVEFSKREQKLDKFLSILNKSVRSYN